MKRIIIFSRHIILIAILFSPPALFSQKNSNRQFVLRGKIAGTETGLVHLEYFNSSKIYKVDSCYLKNGEFKFLGLIEEPAFAFFYKEIKPRSVDDPNFTEIVLEPGSMQAYLKAGDFQHGKITGSKSQMEFEKYMERRNNVRKKWSVNFDMLHKAQENGDTATANKFLDQQFPLYQAEGKVVDINYIKELPYSYVSSMVLASLTQSFSIDSLKLMYSILSPAVQESVNGKIVAEFIQTTEKFALGMPAPDFIKADMYGKDISLKDFKGKYVFLDFWASWCGPCRAENPNLKKVYSLYHEKGFEILGISLDLPDFKNAWLAAIKQDSLPWPQLSLGREVIKDYSIQRIPASFLIDPNGKIVAKDLRGEELEKKLGELIK